MWMITVQKIRIAHQQRSNRIEEAKIAYIMVLAINGVYVWTALIEIIAKNCVFLSSLGREKKIMDQQYL